MKKISVLLALVLTVCLFAACAATEEPPKIDHSVSAEKYAGLKAAWETEDGEGRTFPRQGEVRYYGTYGGCEAYFVPFDSMLNLGKTLTVADKDFSMAHDTYEILVCKNGELLELSMAYDDGLLSKKDVSDIAYYHSQLSPAEQTK